MFKEVSNESDQLITGYFVQSRIQIRREAFAYSNYQVSPCINSPKLNIQHLCTEALNELRNFKMNYHY